MRVLVEGCGDKSIAQYRHATRIMTGPHLTTVVCSPGSVITPNTYIVEPSKINDCHEIPSLQVYIISLEGTWW